MSSFLLDRITPDGYKWKKLLLEIKDMKIDIGFQSGEGTYKDGTDIVDVAMYNEFGTGNIPSRPFMRQSVDNHEGEWNRAFEKFTRNILNDMDAKRGMQQLGEYGKRMVQKEIKNGGFIANAQSTVRKKKSDKPLIDTGRMRQSVNYYIKKGGS